MSTGGGIGVYPGEKGEEDGEGSEDHGPRAFTAWIGHKRRVLYAFLKNPIDFFGVMCVFEIIFVKLGVIDVMA